MSRMVSVSNNVLNVRASVARPRATSPFRHRPRPQSRFHWYSTVTLGLLAMADGATRLPYAVSARGGKTRSVLMLPWWSDLVAWLGCWLAVPGWPWSSRACCLRSLWCRASLFFSKHNVQENFFKNRCPDFDGNLSLPEPANTQMLLQFVEVFDDFI